MQASISPATNTFMKWPEGWASRTLFAGLLQMYAISLACSPLLLSSSCIPFVRIRKFNAILTGGRAKRRGEYTSKHSWSYYCKSFPWPGMPRDRLDFPLSFWDWAFIESNDFVVVLFLMHVFLLLCQNMKVAKDFVLKHVFPQGELQVIPYMRRKLPRNTLLDLLVRRGSGPPYYV